MSELFIGELVGTALLVTLGNGVVANQLLGKTKGRSTGWVLITVGWGFAVAISVYAVGRLSGAHINPAVTIALLSIGDVRQADVGPLLAGQFLGAFLGAIIVWIAYAPHWSETEDPDEKLAVFCTGPAIRAAGANLACEFIGTAILLFGILAIAANGNELVVDSQVDVPNLYGTGIQPFLVGVLVTVIGMSLGGPTGFAINPARDLGPRIAHWLLPIPGKRDSDWAYAWIPVVGPIAGGLAGAYGFRLLDRLS
jgi:glycerol uptake facilitator protein